MSRTSPGGPIALTMGEPAGIGPDITLQCRLERETRGLPAFYCLDDPEVLSARAALIGLRVPVEIVEPSGAAEIFERALPVVPLAARAEGRPGAPFRSSPDHGTAFSLAGKGTADPSSLAAAVRLAAGLARNEPRG